MSLAKEISRVEKLIKIQKKLVHEPRNGMPIIQGVAGLWQQQLKQSKHYLKELQAAGKEQKKERKKRRGSIVDRRPPHPQLDKLLIAARRDV